MAMGFKASDGVIKVAMGLGMAMGMGLNLAMVSGLGLAMGLGIGLRRNNLCGSVGAAVLALLMYTGYSSYKYLLVLVRITTPGIQYIHAFIHTWYLVSFYGTSD